ncbi:MAG: hypothetical protein K0A90_00155 [Methanosarcinaceae archaeon]|nr:hypothetical protein [Methanosarcinaceae archaeon]
MSNIIDKIKDKKFRLLKNPKQTADEVVYYINGVEAVTVPKSGYYFSMDKEMDGAVEFLKKELGFIEVN